MKDVIRPYLSNKVLDLPALFKKIHLLILEVKIVEEKMVQIDCIGIVK